MSSFYHANIIQTTGGAKVTRPSAQEVYGTDPNHLIKSGGVAQTSRTSLCF